VTLTPEVKIINALCKHCGQQMIRKDYCSDESVTLDENGIKTTGEYVLSDEKCPSCGCNLFDVEFVTNIKQESKQV
jgi:ribosomal protein L32